jgi:hypothetical protein
VGKTIQEAKKCGYRFGLISLDREGNIVTGKTLDSDYELIYASYDGHILKVFP